MFLNFNMHIETFCYYKTKHLRSVSLLNKAQPDPQHSQMLQVHPTRASLYAFMRPIVPITRKGIAAKNPKQLFVD